MRAFVPCALLLLCACGTDEKAVQDGRQRVHELDLQPILHADLEKNGLLGAACAFMPYADNGAMVVLAQENAGWLKLDGKLHRLTADKASGGLPYGVFSRYSAGGLMVELSLEKGDPVHSGPEVLDQRGAMAIHAINGRLVYKARGMVQCGS